MSEKSGTTRPYSSRGHHLVDTGRCRVRAAKYPAKVSSNVSLSQSGPPETRLSADSLEVQHLVGQIVSVTGEASRVLAADAVRLAPRSSLVWWACGRSGRDAVERYAAFRVGYHRGLDALRANGWKGSGFVRWSHPGNVGFLRCLLGLQVTAGELGEHDEEERCRLFLLQLDPSGVPPAELRDSSVQSDQ